MAGFSTFEWQMREEEIWRITGEVLMARLEMAYSTFAYIPLTRTGHMVIFTAREMGNVVCLYAQEVEEIVLLALLSP